MGSLGLVTFVSVLAEAISENLEDGELNLLGAILTQLGDTLTTIAVHRDLKSSEVAKAPEGDEK